MCLSNYLLERIVSKEQLLKYFRWVQLNLHCPAKRSIWHLQPAPKLN